MLHLSIGAASKVREEMEKSLKSHIWRTLFYFFINLRDMFVYGTNRLNTTRSKLKKFGCTARVQFSHCIGLCVGSEYGYFPRRTMPEARKTKKPCELLGLGWVSRQKILRPFVGE